MNDHSTHVNAGGDIVGSAIGDSKVDAQVIQAARGRIESSANIDIQGKALFKDALNALADQDWGDELKSEMVGELEKLRGELAKQKPSDGMVKKCWAAILGVAGALPAITKLGEWLRTTLPHMFQ